MKKFILNTIVLICAYALLHVLVVCIFGKNLSYYRIGSSGHMFTRIKEIPCHSSPDILFLGSSHSFRGFDPRVFLEHGITSFNFGSSCQTPKQTEVLLKKYLNEINPKMIVFEVYPILFQSDGIESTTDLISNDHIDFEISKLAVKSRNVKVMNTLIYGLFQEYICSIREVFKEDEFKDKDGDLYIFGGFVEKVDYSLFLSDTFSSNNFKPIRMQSDQLRAFEHCINIIKSNNIPYILVIAPLPKSTNHNINNIYEFGRIMSSYGKFVDFNTIIQLDDTCFYDFHHLNQSGVRFFNESFIQVLDTIELKY